MNQYELRNQKQEFQINNEFKKLKSSTCIDNLKGDTRHKNEKEGSNKNKNGK